METMSQNSSITILKIGNVSFFMRPGRVDQYEAAIPKLRDGPIKIARYRE